MFEDVSSSRTTEAFKAASAQGDRAAVHSASLPTNQYGYEHGNPPEESRDADEQFSDGKRPHMLSLGFLQSLTGKKNTRSDGQSVRRPGPSPDRKPALTSQQERNRMAQRTYRERKEHYVRDLEQEVSRLEGNHRKVILERERLATENKAMKSLLEQYRGPFLVTGLVALPHSRESPGHTSTGRMPSGYVLSSHESSDVPPNPLSTIPPPIATGYGLSLAQHGSRQATDPEQAGVDTFSTDPDFWMACMMSLSQQEQWW